MSPRRSHTFVASYSGSACRRPAIRGPPWRVARRWTARSSTSWPLPLGLRSRLRCSPLSSTCSASTSRRRASWRSCVRSRIRSSRRQWRRRKQMTPVSAPFLRGDAVPKWHHTCSMIPRRVYASFPRRSETSTDALSVSQVSTLLSCGGQSSQTQQRALATAPRGATVSLGSDPPD